MTSLTIVHYHRFDQPLAREGLAVQCEYLTQAYDVVSIDEAIATLNTGTDRTSPMAVVCVDDGHHDFFSIAFPAFRDHGINAICYLVTDFVDGTDWLWCDKVNFLLARTDTLPPGTDRARAARMVKEQLKRLPNRDRVEQLRHLPETLGVALPAEPPDAYRAITWTQAREMRAAGMSFGVHTRTHPILSRLSERELVNEIADSRERCEAELGVPARHFCYPNGRAEDIGDRAPSILRAHGFETAVTTIGGINSAHTDRMRLHRIWVEPDLSLAQFRQRLATACHD